MNALKSAADLRQYLAQEHTQWACSEVEKLSGGTANLTCRGKLAVNGKTIFIKHAAELSGNGWSLPASRANDEQLLLARLQEDLPPISHGAASIRTPKLLSYLAETHTGIIEDVQAIDVKSYLSQERIDPNTCLELGQALGLWTQNMHEWGRSPAQTDVRDALKDNGNVLFKHAINQGRLERSLKANPELYEQIQADIPAITAFLEPKEPDIGVIHGDFWCGNLLLSPPNKDKSANWSIYVTDFELTQVSLPSADLGQMLAELYLLYHFWSRPEALEIMKGFISTYKLSGLTDEVRFRTTLHFGIHLAVWPPVTPSWMECGEEPLKACIQHGIDCILAAHRKNKDFWKSHILGNLFR